MKYVYQLQNKLREEGLSRIGYYVDSGFENMFTSLLLSINQRLHPSCELIYEENDFSKIEYLANQEKNFNTNFGCILMKDLSSTQQSQNSLHILKITNNKLFINEKNISIEKLEEQLLYLISNNESVLLEIRIDEDTHFEYYLKTLDILQSIKIELIEKYAQELFQTNFHELNSEERKQVNEKYYNFYPMLFSPKEWEYYDYLNSHK